MLAHTHYSTTLQSYTTIFTKTLPTTRQLLFDFMDQKQSQSTEIMIQGGNNHEQALQYITTTIRAKIRQGAQKTESFFSTACIYRVPEELRKLKECAYTPRLIAISPLHRSDKHLQTPMQDVKMSYANHLLYRLTDVIQDQEFAEEERFTILQGCVAEMKASIDDVKKCYAEEVTVDEEMMLVDGCFILELFYRFYLMSLPKEATNGGDHSGSSNVSKLGASPPALSTPLLQVHSTSSEPNKEKTGRAAFKRIARAPVALASSSIRPKIADHIFDSNLTATTVQHDLLLLENQIPFLVLERLFQLTVARITDKILLTDLVDLYFCNMMIGNSTNSASVTTTNCGSPSDCVVPIFGNKRMDGGEEEKKYYHILHKIHEYYLPCDEEKKKEKEKEEKKKNERSEVMPPASELDFAGIKLVGATGKDIFKVTFDEPKGLFWWCHLPRFEIPTLGIYNSTEPFLRNLIALEQCVPRVLPHFTSYAFLMDMLVNSEKDVVVLEKAGVLHNYLGGSKDATDLFNNLRKEVVIGEFFFAEMCTKATEYSGRFWPKNLAYAKRTFFASPWTFIAFCVGFIAFVISITSFVLSLL